MSTQWLSMLKKTNVPAMPKAMSTTKKTRAGNDSDPSNPFFCISRTRSKCSKTHDRNIFGYLWIVQCGNVVVGGLSICRIGFCRGEYICRIGWGQGCFQLNSKILNVSFHVLEDIHWTPLFELKYWDVHFMIFVKDWLESFCWIENTNVQLMSSYIDSMITMFKIWWTQSRCLSARTFFKLSDSQGSDI